MPHTTTVQEIKNFFDHIEKIQTIQDTAERNKAIESVFGELLNNDLAKLGILYTLFSETPKDSQYQQLLIYATFRVLLEQNGVATEQAMKLYTLFNKDINKIKKYLCDYAKQNLNSPKPMHDACNFSTPAPNSKYTSQVWTDLSAKYLAELPFRQLLAQAPEIEALIKRQSQAIPHPNKPNKKAISDLTKEIETLNSSIKKYRARASSLTDEEEMLLKQKADSVIEKKRQLTSIGIPFNNELSLTALSAFREKYVFESSRSYKQFLENGLTKKDHDKFTNLIREDDDTIIPPLRIDGSTIGHPGYYLMKVPVLDEAHAARAAYFGKLTRCCQSLSGELGEPCVIHGLTSPNGGFYVICHGDLHNPQITDEVLGQSWVWHSKTNALVFDSIECAKKNTPFYKITKEIVKKLVFQAAKQVLEQPDIERVLCGASSSGISQEIGITEAFTTEQPKDYTGFSDARNQLILKDKHRPFYFLDIDAAGTQNALAWISEKLKNKAPLTDSHSLWEALNWAILYGNTYLIERIQSLATQEEIHREAEVNDLVSNLESYIDYGLSPTITAAIEQNTFPLEARNREEEIPLMLTKDVNLISTLIQKKANIENTDKEGKTALIRACESRNTEAVITLIKAKANLEHSDSQRKTAVIWAAGNRNSTTIMALIQAGANLEHLDNTNQTALIHAIKSKNTDAVIMSLIKKTTNLGQVDKYGETALMYSIWAKKTDISLFLIETKANLEHIDNNGETALMFAIKTNNPEIALALIQAQANVEHTDKYGHTALMHAIKSKNTKIALALIQSHANLEHIDKYGETALMHSIKAGNTEIISAIEERLKVMKTEKMAYAPAQQESNKPPETKTEHAEPPPPDVIIRHRRPSR